MPAGSTGSLPSITVYPDGTVLRAGFEVEGLTITRGQVEMTRVDELVALARQAGLTGGGVQAILPLPDGIGVADGGGSVFSYRDGDTITTRDVPHLYDFDGWNRSGERGLFLELQMALYALEASEPFDWSGEALLVQTSPAIEPDPAPWTGPDFRNGTRETILGGCAIVAPLGPLTVEASWIRDYDVHGERWTISRRPLLPHEFSCADLELYSKLRPAAR